MRLHRVQWNQGDIFQDIFNSYINYLKKRFPSDDITVVFDGHDLNAQSIKACDRIRRSKKVFCPDVHFHLDGQSRSLRKNFSQTLLIKVDLSPI